MGVRGGGRLHEALMQAILQREARVTQVECQSEGGPFWRGQWEWGLDWGGEGRWRGD